MEIESRNDFKYDLKLGRMFEGEIANMFSEKKIEVKTDLLAVKTGNVFIELYSRGHKSGLITTEADYYAFVFPKDLGFVTIFVSVERLKKLVRVKFDESGLVCGGDLKISKGVLLKVNDLWKQQ